MHSPDGAEWVGELGQSALRRCPSPPQVSTDECYPARCSAPHDRVAALLNERVAVCPICPRCGSARVQRWGKVDGVQRLRCRGCARTFNPLTGTPLARLRRRGLWLEHARVLEAGLSLRRGAETLGVHYNTTLRWRHRWLERPREQMARRFTGAVAAEIVTFEPCAHQPRGWIRVALPADQAPVVPAGDRPPPAGAVTVLMFRDQRGARADAILTAPASAGLEPILDALVDPAGNRLCNDGRPANRASWATLGIAHSFSRSNPSDQRRLVACRRRLQSWMHRFAGVSTHRLANYLGWRRLLEAPGGRLAPARWLDRALGTHQQSTVTGGGGRLWWGDGLEAVGRTTGAQMPAIA